MEKAKETRERAKMEKENPKSSVTSLKKTEDGCNKGQHCSRFHRVLKPEERRCHVCGSTKHMANVCDRPKKEDPPPKGGKDGKDGKGGKGKPKGGKDGK